ncbi:MAG TPA: dihydroorotase [Bdellovibrionota bacterium]|nr:dihydroorotase [Bdellovibrionota bacterium]
MTPSRRAGDVSALLIRGGRFVGPATRVERDADILLKDGKISAVDKPGAIPTPAGGEVFEAKGMLVLPGLIDLHVHLREPGLTHKETIETGTRAAVAGGFTSVACMANTMPVNDSAGVTALINEKARSQGRCRVFPVGAVTEGLRGEKLAALGAMAAEGAVAFSDDGEPVMNSLVMRRAMEYATHFGLPVISHAEDKNLSGKGLINEGAISARLGLEGNPAASEEIIVARDIALCRLTRCRLHIAHISTKLAVDLVRRAKAEGLPITAEVTPHHLMLTDASVVPYRTCCKMAPPLRTQDDLEAVRAALADGTIDVIATDHAPHSELEKDVEYDHAPNGIIGVETAVAVTYSLVREGKLPLMRWVDALTLSPAKILSPGSRMMDLGTLKVGASADVTVIDPDLGWTYSAEEVRSKSRNTPWLGEKLTARAVLTVVGGEIRHRL